MRLYPRIGEGYKIPKPRGMCVLCHQSGADYRITIQNDIFRGNDTVYKVHFKCLKNVERKVLIEELQK